jgi:acetyltransferase-like isoleucine patch superfamily enzyme
MPLLSIIFKVFRKLGLFFHKKCVQYNVYSWKVLSKGRFIFQPPYFIGRGLSLNTDLTETVINVGKNLRVRNDFNITIGDNGQLLIHENCFFNNRCSINCLGKIKIGSHNQFGENVLMYDHNHQYQDAVQLISAQGYQVGSIIIGNNCWIGSNVVILKDVVIGDNVVIGAGCVIHKSIPANSVVIKQQDLLIKQREIS